MFKFSEAQNVPHTLFNYFTAPELDMLFSKAGDFVDFDYELRFADRLNLYKKGLKKLVGSDSLPEQILFLRKLSPAIRRGLKDTIFLDEHMIAHSHLESCVSYTSLTDERFINGPSDRTSSALFDGLALLGMYLRA